MKNSIYLWTGNGAGKTTSALGAALRCAGQKKKVIVVQFMKGRKDIGEVKVAKKIKTQNIAKSLNIAGTTTLSSFSAKSPISVVGSTSFPGSITPGDNISVPNYIAENSRAVYPVLGIDR